MTALRDGRQSLELYVSFRGGADTRSGEPHRARDAHQYPAGIHGAKSSGNEAMMPLHQSTVPTIEATPLKTGALRLLSGGSHVMLSATIRRIGGRLLERGQPHQRERHMRVIVAAGVAIISAATLAPTALALDKVHFQYSWIPTGEYAPISAGLEKGFFTEQGIELTYASGRGSGDAVKKVATGGAIVGDGDISAVMAARSREKAPVKCLMSQHAMAPHSVFVLESSGINTIKDLVGKTLVTTPGNSHYLYFPLVAKLNGLAPDSVKWVNSDATAMAPMLISGRVDGAPLFATHYYYQNKQAEKVGKKIKVIPYADYGFKIYSYCWLATEESIRTNGDVIRRFLLAVRKSYLWAKDNLEETAKLHNKRHPDVDVDDAMGSMRIMYQYMFPQGMTADAFGYFEPERLKETYRVVAMAQDLDPTSDPAQFIDTSLLPPRK
jgi:NitT/TauT family transport system substrate-binding protein